LIGLDGTGASLLGTGVMAARGLLKVGFDWEETSAFLTEVGSDRPGLGELVAFFWKKPRIDF
jgi:hypothetical protein